MELRYWITELVCDRDGSNLWFPCLQIIISTILLSTYYIPEAGMGTLYSLSLIHKTTLEGNISIINYLASKPVFPPWKISWILLYMFPLCIPRQPWCGLIAKSWRTPKLCPILSSICLKMN